MSGFAADSEKPSHVSHGWDHARARASITFLDFAQSITMSALRAVQRRLTDETEAGV